MYQMLIWNNYCIFVVENFKKRYTMNEEKVLEALAKAGQPMKAGEIAEATSIPKADVDKAIKALVKEGKVESPKRCFYAPKA